MNKKTPNQIRHESIVRHVHGFSQYKKEGIESFKTRQNPLFYEELDQLSVNEIQNAAIVFTDVLNINSGSSGNMDLYKILPYYLRDSEMRNAINKAIDSVKRSREK